MRRAHLKEFVSLFEMQTAGNQFFHSFVSISDSSLVSVPLFRLCTVNVILSSPLPPHLCFSLAVNSSLKASSIKAFPPEQTRFGCFACFLTSSGPVGDSK